MKRDVFKTEGGGEVYFVVFCSSLLFFCDGLHVSACVCGVSIVCEAFKMSK